VPAPLTAAAQQLRTALCLDDQNTDYYLQAYAALIEAYPDLKSMLNDPAVSYSVHDFLPRGVVSVNCALVSNSASSGTFTDPKPTGLPLALTYNIGYVASGLCQITQLETGVQVMADCLASADPQEIWLRINWPSNIPFSGLLQLNQPWAPGLVVQLIVSPSQFPYAAALAGLASQPYFSLLLQRFQLQETFQNTVDPQDSLALALAVIASGNPAAYPPS
jgi:hypothetical protein